jgi:hypothetical protein
VRSMRTPIRERRDPAQPRLESTPNYRVSAIWRGAVIPRSTRTTAVRAKEAQESGGGVTPCADSLGRTVRARTHIRASPAFYVARPARRRREDPVDSKRNERSYFCSFTGRCTRPESSS